MNNSIPPGEGVSMLNTLTKSELEQVKAKLNSGHLASEFNADPSDSLSKALSWIKKDRETGHFIAMPMRMVALKNAGLKANELLTLAFIFGFQRKEPGAVCSVSRTAMSEILGVRPNSLSTRLGKLEDAGVITQLGKGASKSYAVDEAKWAVLVRATVDPENLSELHRWARGGEFARIPRWISSSKNLSALEKMLFGVVYSRSTWEGAAVYSKSLQNTALDLGVTRQAIVRAYGKLLDLELVKKRDVAKTVPAEYTIDTIGCHSFASRL